MFRASVTANSSGANPAIVVPATVQGGDQLLLIVTANTSTTAGTPAGWTLLGTRQDGGPDVTSWVFARTAAANTAGTTVVTPLGGSAKSSRMLLAYAGGAPTVTATSSVIPGNTVALTTPAASIAAADTVVVSYWANKTSGNTGWVLPAGVTNRASSLGSGSGRITAAIGDAVVGAGNWPGATATSSVTSGKGIGWTVVIPASSVPTNQLPTATFTSSCVHLTCSFDASGSTDPDGSIVAYTWNFGDGSSASGLNVSKTYSAAGTDTVALAVTDDRGGIGVATRSVTTTAPPMGGGALPPSTTRTDMPRITTGEITDLEYIGNRVFIAGTFSSIANNRGGNTTSYNQRYLASFNLDTGLVDAGFRPTFDSTVQEIEASPDGRRLYVVGRFNTVNGVTKRKIAALDPVTGAVIPGFTAHANAAGTAVEATNSTVYVGGQFSAVNGTPRTGLAALDATTGAVVNGFANDLSGGIGVNGLLTVQALVLSPDLNTLLVVHTGRRIAGQDRYGVGLIDTRSNQLLPWRTRLWEDNLQFVGGIQRAYAGAISPDGQYFVVTSGSGGDRPPINDTAIAFSLTGGDFAEPLWISRLFDSVYSVAISADAVYVGGHFNYAESPSAPDPWPGLTNVGYGRGQGLAGYGLGDDIVIRNHIGALDPADGKSLEWNPGSNSFEGNKAMLVHPRGVITGGDALTQGSANVGRIAVYDFAAVPAVGQNETAITLPIEGRVARADEEFVIEGTATATSGVRRVQLEIQDRDRNLYLQDDLTTWGAFNTIYVPLASPNATSTTWSQPVTLSGNRRIILRARTVGLNNSQDASKAIKTFETFGLADETPATSINGPSGSVIPTLVFTLTGTAGDDFGVNAINYSVRDVQNRYLQDDGSVSGTYNTFRVQPDVIGATSATWSAEVTVPYESQWSVEAIAVDTAGQADLRGAARTWIVSATAIAPTVTITAPAAVNPPTATAPITMLPGAAVTFSGTAIDDEGLKNVEITLRNTVTRENLANDGSWGVDSLAGVFRISPLNLSGTTYNWSYTTPFDLAPGSYVFSVRATDDLDLTTTSANRGNLTINVQVPDDLPPDGRLDITGTQPNQPSLQLDLTGTATDDIGVASVMVTLRERESGRYVQANGSLSAAFHLLPTVLANPGATSTTWSYSTTLLAQGDYDVTAFAFDTSGQQDPSTSGATARYRFYPGDQPPVFNETLFSPSDGASFDDGKIVVSGRVEDDQQIAQVQIAIVDGAGRYMNSSGAFTSTTASYRSAFLNSPGSPGSNFSYTSPVIPAGVYTVLARGVDQHGFMTSPSYQRTGITVAAPANQPPVANFTYSCTENVCSFDGRSSTDENVTTLVYSWSFGQGSASGPVPTRTYTAPGTYTAVLTVRDEYNATATFSLTLPPITEPTGNLPPVPTIGTPSCVGLVCNFSGVGSADPNPGDTFSYRWDFGDGGSTSSSTAPARTFPAPGTYTVTLTTTDGWGKAATVTRTVTVVAA
ncbi:MAG: PKD domain-containing protein [Ilumatobacteraceae bacterium]|nr:PKD domain-containing protein [Ilumatobacteraceae bacterium]